LREEKTMDSIVENRIKTMLPLLDEKQKRIYLAAEAESLGYGGLKAVHELTGVSKTTIIRGKKNYRKALLSGIESVESAAGGSPPHSSMTIFKGKLKGS
jgi:hypothetical protein